MAATTFHVDLNATDSDAMSVSGARDGSREKPFNWSQVVAWLRNAPVSGGYDVAFALSGSNTSALTMSPDPAHADGFGRGPAVRIQNTSDIRILFKRDTDSATVTTDSDSEAQIPVLAGTGGFSSFLDIVGSTNVAIEIAGILFHTTFSASAVLVQARDCVSTRIRAHNNILGIAGAAVGFASASNCTRSSGFGVGFNTVLVRSVSTYLPVPLLGVGNNTSSNAADRMSAAFVGNFVANHTDSRFIVTGAVIGSGNDFVHGSNVYGGSQSYLLPYSSAGANHAIGQDRTCNYDTESVCGVSWFNADTATGFASNDISGYWPTQGGALLGYAAGFATAISDAGIVDSAKLLLDGFGVADINGRLRYGYDAGAVEKSCVTRNIQYHVDLGVVGTASLIGSGNGSRKYPLSVADYKRLHARLAPCNNDVTFILRRSNHNAALSAAGGIQLDLGPRVNGTEFTGTGSVTFSGYRVFVRKPPVLAVTKIKSNTCVRTRFQGIKILWTEGSDLFQADPARNTTSGTVEVARSVVRSVASKCSSALVSIGAGAPIFRSVGSTWDTRHITGTGSGLFVFGNSARNLMFGNVIVMPGTGTVVGSSDIVNGEGTLFDGNYINCSRGQSGVSGNPTWSFIGNNGQHNVADVADTGIVFKSAETEFADADYALSGDVNSPLEIIPIQDVPADASELYASDLRGCSRDASTGARVGAATGDAGAYEYSYAVPVTKTYYVDLGRAGSGHLGLRNDRWSYTDLANYLESLSGNVLHEPVVIRCLGTGFATRAIVVDSADSMPFASLRIEAESPFSLPTLHVAVDTSWLLLRGGAGFVFGIDSVIVTTAAPFPLLECVTGTADSASVTQSDRDADDVASLSELRVFNSICHRIESQMLIVTDTDLVVASQASLNGTITAGGIVKRLGTDIVVTSNAENSEAAVAIASAFNHDTNFKAAGYVASTPGGGAVAFDGPATLSMSSAVAGITLHSNSADSHPLIRSDLSRAVAVIGSGFGIVRSAGCSRDVVAIDSRRGVVAYSSFTSDTSTSSGAGSVAVFGSQALRTQFNAAHGFASGCVFNTQDTGSRRSVNIVAQDALNKSVYALNFKAVGEAIGIAPITNISDDVLGFGVDYDAVRSLRSRTAYSAGAVEAAAQEIDGTLTDASEPAISGLTEEGSTWNSRKVTDGFGFRIVGYAIGGSGYASYAVNRPLPYRQLSKPGQIRLTLTDNVFGSGDSIGFVFGTGADAASVTFTYNTLSGWRAGSSIGESLKNIAAALRSHSVFNTYCYCYIVSATLVVVSRRFHASANTYTCSCNFVPNATNLQFSGAVTAPEPANKVWPRFSPYALFDRMEEPEQGSRGFVIRLGFEDCNYPIGQFAVIAECVASPIPGEVGTRCVYAYANAPLHVKHNREIVVKRLIFQF